MKNRQIQLSRLVPLFVIAIAVAIGLCVSVTAFIHVKIAVERSQKNNVQREMEGIVHDFSSFLNMRKLILRDYAEFPLITQTVMQPEKNFINIRDFMRGMSILGERYQMSLLDFEGNTIHARQKGPGFDYTSSPWLDEVMNGNIEGYAGISEKANKYFWCIAVPVKYNGFAEGVLVTEIPIEAVVEYFNYSERLKGMQLEVIHEDKSIFSTGKKLSVAPSDILIQEFGFVLRYRVDEQPIHAAINAMLVQIFAALLALTMAVVWISVYLGKRFLVFPLEKLLQQTTDLSKGNRVESVTITRNIWDIAELANRFNLMSERVQQREEALKESV
ncbi:MAG: two-component system NtrC family sensor kinase, partial [Candidatus Omnitrophota bacterium]